MIKKMKMKRRKTTKKLKKVKRKFKANQVIKRKRKMDAIIAAVEIVATARSA